MFEGNGNSESDGAILLYSRRYIVVKRFNGRSVLSFTLFLEKNYVFWTASDVAAEFFFLHCIVE
jgi:hypothetical protein